MTGDYRIRLAGIVIGADLKLGLLADLFSYGGLQLYAVALATGPSNLAAPIFATNSLVVAASSILVYKKS